jgi:hypothetical protein
MKEAVVFSLVAGTVEQPPGEWRLLLRGHDFASLDFTARMTPHCGATELPVQPSQPRQSTELSSKAISSKNHVFDALSFPLNFRGISQSSDCGGSVGECRN